MNERIKQLMAEADRKCSETRGIYDEILAELIVKECLDQCYNRGMNDELYAGQLKAAAYIEEHFGVEE
jgi:hypothetical protein